MELANCEICYYCNQNAINSCEKCHLVGFCSDKNHQSWHRNSNSCLPFKVVQHPDKGQCLVATRQIKPLEIILSEKPTILGPYTRPAKRQCLECFKLINEDQKCSKCLYPVCDLKCQDGNWHLIECQIFQSVGHTYRQPNSEDGDKSSNESNPSLWKAILTLRDHNSERRALNPDLWAKLEKPVANFVVNTCKMAPNEDIVIKIMGILATNSAHLDLEHGYGQGCALYATFAKVNHSCYGKTKNVNQSQIHKLHLRASTYIEIGEEICNQYSKPLINTLERRYNLNNRWHFNCMCLRCEDPYELGSNLSSLNCPLRRSSQKNCSGSMVSDMPLNSQSDWACDECGTKRPWSYIMDSLNSAQKVLKSMARDLDIISHYERFLYEQSEVFHPNHQILINVEMHLALLYGNVKPFTLMELSQPQLERKLQCIRNVLDTLSKVDTGYSSLRGKLLNELMKTKVFMAQKQFLKGKIDKEMLDQILMQQRANQNYLTFHHNLYLKDDVVV